MNISILVIGKTSEEFVKIGLNKYFDRIRHYTNIKQIDINDIKDKKNYSPGQVKEKEAAAILLQIPKSSIVILLDEQGIQHSSTEFATFLQKQLNKGSKELCFIIGGAYGVSDEIRQKANYVIAMSKMTFTHQFIRVILAEQIYRAFTILKNEPYHNE